MAKQKESVLSEAQKSVVTPERFAQGLTYEQWSQAIDRNQARFQENYDGTQVSDDDACALRELVALPNGPARCLALGEAWCPDVFRGMPVMARIAEATCPPGRRGGIALRCFFRDQNKDIMAEFLNDGQHESIPTFVFYTRDHRYIAHWIERPALANEQMPELRKTTEALRNPDLSQEERQKAIGAYIDFQQGHIWAGWRQCSTRGDAQQGRLLTARGPASYDGRADRGGVSTREVWLAVVRHIAALLFIIALPIALITTNVRIAANEPRVYQYAADHYDTPQTTGIAREELLRASGELRDYFNNDEDSIFVRVEKDGEPISLFNSRETAHLRDVKTLFHGSFRVQEATAVFVLAYVVTVFIWAREGSLRTLAREVVASGLVSLAAIGIVGGIAVAGFDAAFERFHLIAFDNDFWKLDPDRDHLIQMFPEAFWRDLSLWIGIGTLAELAVLVAAAGAYLGLTRRRPATPFALPESARA